MFFLFFITIWITLDPPQASTNHLHRTECDAKARFPAELGWSM